MTEPVVPGPRPDRPVAFVYGTLTDADRAVAVADDHEFRGRATLSGLHAVEGEYPTLAPGGTVAGRLLWVDDLAAVDAYEGVDEGLYLRAAVSTADGGAVWTYVGDPARLGVDDAVDWPGDGALSERVAAYVREHDVRVRPRADDSDG